MNALRSSPSGLWWWRRRCRFSSFPAGFAGALLQAGAHEGLALITEGLGGGVGIAGFHFSCCAVLAAKPWALNINARASNGCAALSWSGLLAPCPMHGCRGESVAKNFSPSPHIRRCLPLEPRGVFGEQPHRLGTRPTAPNCWLTISRWSSGNRHRSPAPRELKRPTIPSHWPFSLTKLRANRRQKRLLPSKRLRPRSVSPGCKVPDHE